MTIPFERSNFGAVQSFHEAENALLALSELSKPYATSEAIFAEEKLLSRVHEIAPDDATQCHANSEQTFQLIEDGKSKSLVQQMWDIVTFAVLALGIWMSVPMMSLIDTAVVLGRFSVTNCAMSLCFSLLQLLNDCNIPCKAE